MPLLFVGIETEGTPVYNARIVEVAAVLVSEDFSETAHFDAILTPPAIKGVPKEEAALELRRLIGQFPDAMIRAFGVSKAKRLLAAEPWGIPAERWGDCVRKSAIDKLIQAMAIGALKDGTFKMPGLWDAAAHFDIEPSATGSRALDRARATAQIFYNLKDDMNLVDEAKYIMENGL